MAGLQLARSGTESIYKIYMESFKGEEHLDLIQKEAHRLFLRTG